MAFFKSLVLGLIAGAAAFFPLSSSGVLTLGARFLSVQIDRQLFTSIMIGLLLALILTYLKDIIRLLYSFAGIVGDLLFNLKMYLRPNPDGSRDYRRILTGNYRNFLVLLLAAIIPQVIAGLLLADVASAVYGNFLIAGMMFFITAVILLVSSFMNVPEKGPRQMKIPEALVLGAFSGCSFIPGLSKIASVSSAGFLCGLSRRLTVKFACLLNLISLLLIILPGRLHPVFEGAAKAGFPSCVAGFLGGCLGGFLLIRRAQKMISKESNKVFAGCNVLLGMMALLVRMLAH